MQITGILKTIGETQVVSDKFKKREFVLETDHTTQYPQTILLEFQQDKVYLLDHKSIGLEYRVDFNLKGRQWTNDKGEVKTFNTLHAWKIEAIGAAPTNTEEQVSPTNNDDSPF